MASLKFKLDFGSPFILTGVAALLVISLAVVAQGIVASCGWIGNRFLISDIAMRLVVYGDFWGGKISSPYTLAGQIAALSHNFLGPIPGAMPLSDLPSALFVWWPFALLSQIQLSFGIFAWLLCSILACLFALRPIFAKSEKDARQKFILLGAIVLLSSSFSYWLLHGQTTLLAISVFIYWLSENQPQSTCRKQLAKDSLALLILSLKPTYLCVGIIYLCIRRGVRPVIAPLAFVVLLNILALELCSGLLQGTHDYLGQLSMLAANDIPAAYQGANAHLKQNTLFNLIAPSIGATKAALASNLLFFLSALAALLTSNLARFKNDIAVTQSTVAKSRSVLACLPLAAMLCFLPRLGDYEELLLVVLICNAALLSPGFFEGKLLKSSFLSLVLLVGVTLNYEPIYQTLGEYSPANFLHLALWTLKAITIFGVLFIPFYPGSKAR